MKTILPSKHRRYRLLVPAVLVFLLVLMIPTPAHAEEPAFWDIGGQIQQLIIKMMVEMSQNVLRFYFSLAGDPIKGEFLSTPFEGLLGEPMYNLTSTVHRTAIVPIAESILALFMLVQLIKISQRIDATSTLPAVKDIVFLAVSYVLLHWFIVHSLDVIQAIYGIVANHIIPALGAAAGTTSVSNTVDSLDPASATLGGASMLLLISLIAAVGGMVAFVVGQIVVFARAWQIYVMAAFSAIPVSLLGFDETRQMGIGFLKNFAAACLAGAIMMFLLIAYPYILSGVGVDSGMSMDFEAVLAGSSPNIMENIRGFLTFLASTLLLIFGLVKSGAWAKEILGG